MSMELDFIEHPRLITIRNITINVRARVNLTDAQADTAAMHFYRSRRWTTMHQNVVQQCFWVGDPDLLEPSE